MFSPAASLALMTVPEAHQPAHDAIASGSEAGAPQASTLAKSRAIAWFAALLAPAVVLPLWYFAGPRLFASSYWGTLPGVLLLLVLGVCTVTDGLWRKIPNWVTYPGLFWAVQVALAATLMAPADAAETASLAQVTPAPPGLAQCLEGLIVNFVVLFCIYTVSGGGAGDVKLAAVIGALLGPMTGFYAVLATYIVAGCAVLCWLVVRRGPLVMLSVLGRSVGSLMLPMWVTAPSKEESRMLVGRMPLGPFFALGCLIVVNEWVSL